MNPFKFIFREVIPWSPPKSDPRAEAAFRAYEAAVDTIETGTPGDDDPKLLDLSLKIFDNDASRHTSIDTRAGAMMSAITLAATLVTGVGFTTFKDTSSLPKAVVWAIFVTFALALLYLTTTTVLLFQIQGQVFRWTADPRDLIPPAPATPSHYPREVATKILRYTIENYRVNAQVITKLFVAQKCFRNALLVLVIGGLVASVLLMFPSLGGSSELSVAQALARAAGCADTPALVPDQKGHWHGTCHLAGRSVNVVVDPEGRSELSP
jgi:hypothetical protein